MASVCVALAAATTVARAQSPQRILEQDPNLDNLTEPSGYVTAELGTLGDVKIAGNGPALILIPGFGFDGSVFEPLTEAWARNHTVYSVTLPGFGMTAAPPVPSPGTSFGEQTWTSSAVDTISALIEAQGIRQATVVGHWIGGTQIALSLARRDPTRVQAVVLLAGSARFVTATPDAERPDDRPIATRVAEIDHYLASNWFKTVTRETWDDNNFLPGDYAANPVVGLRLWRQAAQPPLHVWVRYLCEFFAQDVTLELDAVTQPVLLLRPGLEDLHHDPGNNYIWAYTHHSWGDSLDHRENFTVRTVPNTRVVMWVDAPEAVLQAVEEFIDGQAANAFGSVRALLASTKAALFVDLDRQ